MRTSGPHSRQSLRINPRPRPSAKAEPLWTIQEVCNFLGLNLIKARSLIAHRGDRPKPALRTNAGITYYTKSVLIDYLKDHKEKLHV